jgi:hypothetical protein
MVKSVNKDGSISRMAHQERLEVRRVRHGRGRGEAARPARGDEPRIALRGGRALTRAMAPTLDHVAVSRSPASAPPCEGPRARLSATWARPSSCRQPASMLPKEHRDSTSAGLARAANGSLYVLTRRALRSTRHGGRRSARRRRTRWRRRR